MFDTFPFPPFVPNNYDVHLIEQHPPRVKYAALCRAALCPKEFNNYKFWHDIYEQQLNVQVEQMLGSLGYEYGGETPRDILFSCNDTDYVACWPNLKDLVGGLQPLIELNQLKTLLLDCLLTKDPEQRSMFALNLDNLLQLMVLENNSVINETNKVTKIDRKDIRFGNNRNFPLFANQQSITNPDQKPSSDFYKAGFLGNQINFSQPNCYALMLKILAGIIASAGVVAILLAMTLAPPIAIGVGVIGAAAVLGGIGLFCTADKIAPAHVQPMHQNPRP